MSSNRSYRYIVWCLKVLSLVLGIQALPWAPAQAQTYPAIVNFNLAPPYSPYLTDFLKFGQERMTAMVNFLDLSEPSWDAKLKLTITGNGLQLTTQQAFYEQVTLSPGPNLIGTDILENLTNFSKMNVVGMNKNDLVNAGRLPEGTYDFCLEIVDAGREVPLAMPGCRTATLIQNNPPQLTTPECGATISAAGGQNIQFNWIPMHDPSIQTRYEIKIVQVPSGMNPNDAINATTTPILDWEPVLTNSFTYGPNQLPLEMNATYAFQIRVVDILGLTTFENNGKSPVCWFTYGFSTGGEIPLTAPANEVRVDYPDKVDFAWQGPSNALPGQQVKYHLKVVKLNTGEQLGNAANAAGIMARTSGVWYNDSTDIAPNIFGSSLTVEQPLEPGAIYAWQVHASTEGVKIAKSEVWWFKAPPVIFSFWCADGAYNIIVDEVTQHTKVSDTKFTGLAGTGKVVLAVNEQPTEVSFSNLTVELVANKWVLKVGEVVIAKQENKELDFGDYGDGQYAINAWVLTAMEFLAQGQVTWRFPLSVNSPGNAVVVSGENVRLNYMNKVLTGAVPFENNQGYNLLIPMGFQVVYSNQSQFIVQPGGVTKLKLNGRVLFPEALKTVSGDPFSVAFENMENPWYMDIPRMSGGEKLKLVSETKMTLQPKSFTIDFSSAQSPAGIFQSNPEWVGVFFNEYNIFLPSDFDNSERLGLNEEKTITFKSDVPGYQPSWVSSGGLNLDVSHTFEHEFAAPFYASNNTFEGKFNLLRLKIEDNSLSDSKLTGFIRIPFLDPNRKLDWVSPIAANGIQQAYFNEDSIRAFSRTFSKEDSLAKVTLTINQAVFEGGDHLNLNVDILWPYVGVTLTRTPGLKIWGNGDVGFDEPNGKRNLSTQVPVTLGDFSGVADGVGAYYENTVYGFMVFTKVNFPGGLSSPGLPIKVGVAGPGGGPPPPVGYQRVDGVTKSGRFRIGPAKITVDNSLIYMELFADFIDDDLVFGTRFEAKGNVMVKQPNKMVANARLVVGEKNGTGFWYTRVAAQGLNKVLEAYPSYHLNGFDFKIYHHLASPQGSAFTKPSQMNEFWNLDNAKDGSNSIDGHDIDGNVLLGMYGKIGIHDAASGRKQKNGPINITESMPSIGDILPNIPGLCDLTYEGKSICSYVKWPWDGLSLCDIKVPYVDGQQVGMKSICDVDLLDVDWPNLQFCDMAMSNGKKLGDYTLGELGFNNLDICDIKLPNGSGICEYFDISGGFCDIKSDGNALCSKTLCSLMPNIPPVCKWKIPGMKALCNFTIGDLIPDVDICDVLSKAGGESIFCGWSWPDLMPDVPNPCDLKLPNGSSLCSLSLDWCDVMVPVEKNGQITLKPLCQVKWFEIDWPNVNPCSWTAQGQALCNLNIDFCDLKNPITQEPMCDFVPDLCDIREPITGQRLCDLELFSVDWANFDFCSLEWPGTNVKVCDLNLKVCDLKLPQGMSKPWICDFSLRDLLPSIPNFCNIEFKIDGATYKACSWPIDIEIPSICDLTLVNDLQLCTIKLPDFDLPEIEVPEVPGLPGLPENMYQQLLMTGINVEVQNSGAIRKISLQGASWFFTDRLDPNDSYLVRGFGGVELWPAQSKLELHMEAETGSIKTDLGRIKPMCGSGTVDALFTPEDWYIHVGTRNKPWDVNLGCSPFLSCGGFITADNSGILAHGEMDYRAETEGGFDIGPADINFWAKARLYQAIEIGVSFNDPAIYGSIEGEASASAGVEVVPDIGDDYDVEFASVTVGGNLGFKLGSDFCMSGRLYGEVSILGIGVDLTVGVQLKDGSLSFPENPSGCN